MSVARPVSILMFIKKSGIFHVSKQGMLALIKGHLILEQKTLIFQNHNENIARISALKVFIDYLGQKF